MKQITVNLLTWSEAREVELYCKRMYADTKIVPVTLHEDDGLDMYYVVYVLNTNNRWVPARDIKLENVRE